MADKAKTHSVKRVVISVVLGVVIVLGVVLGLHFANVIRLPFLPTSAEIAMALKLDRVTGDGSFDVEVRAKADLHADVSGKKVKLKTEAQASGSVRNFKRNDPYTFKVTDGKLAAEARVTGMASLLLSSALEASGVFEADLTRGIVEYALEKPLAYEGSLSIDVDALKKAPKDEIEVKSLEVEGDTATIVLSGESIAKSEAFQSTLESLQSQGLVTDASLDDVTVVLRLDEPNDRIEITLDTTLDASVLS